MVIWLAKSFRSKSDNPVGIHRWNNVDLTLIERRRWINVESKLFKLCLPDGKLIRNYARILYFIIQEAHSCDIYIVLIFVRITLLRRF